LAATESVSAAMEQESVSAAYQDSVSAATGSAAMGMDMGMDMGTAAGMVTIAAAPLQTMDSDRV